MLLEREFISANPKVFSVESVAEQLDVLEAVNLWKQGSKHISGLVTGCFDILHISQIEFLHRAKNIMDTLIVGVDRNETVALKGSGRPFFDLKQRCEMLAVVDCIDLVFPIPFALKVYEENANSATLFEDLTGKLFNLTSPANGIYCLITNEVTDKFYDEKARRAQKLGINYIGLKVERSDSTSDVAKRVKSG